MNDRRQIDGASRGVDCRTFVTEAPARIDCSLLAAKCLYLGTAQRVWPGMRWRTCYNCRPPADHSSVWWCALSTAPPAHVHVPFVTTDTSYSTDVYTQLTPDCNQHHALISLQSTGHRRRTAVQWFQNTRTGHVITIAATLDNHNCLCRKISIKTF